MPCISKEKIICAEK